MPILKKKIDFFNSAEGVEVEQLLRSMVADSTYNTKSSYSANSGLYPDNLMPFVDKHMNYLISHPAINIRHYISNLRLITRIK